MDRISGLPEFILHDILSFLPYDAAARTSVFSKQWYHLWLSHPVFDFDFEEYFRSMEKERFLRIVDDSLARFQTTDLRMQQFILCVDDLTSGYHSPIDKFIRIALEKDVEELLLFSMNSFYQFPETIFSTSARFFSLRQMELYYIQLSDEFIEIVLRSCPLISHLKIWYCSGLKEVTLSNHLNLEFFQVVLEDKVKIQRVDIEAPGLKFFCLSPGFYASQASALNMGGCQSMRELWFTFLKITDRSFNALVSCFPCIDTLRLDGIDISGRVKISCPLLKKLRFRSRNDKLEKLEVDAPKLEVLSYKGYTIPCIFFDNCREWVVTLCLTHNERLDNLWLLMLVKFFGRSIQRRLFHLKSESTETELAFELKALRELRLAPVQMVELMITSSDTPLLIEALLWIMHPQKLSVIDSPNDFLKVQWLVENIWSTKDSICCYSSVTMCWRHYLKQVKYVKIANLHGNFFEGNFNKENLLDAVKSKAQSIYVVCEFEW